ncbi:hypothetical protein HAX54_010575 [Datura stramonium]|uniref:DUF4283 domain-containing protein n=1 Tax=Datura stramonium TaxID=4076 RepID=A0ABS8TIC5_DATST|nr:hypothetical protein [Datura stramonium]
MWFDDNFMKLERWTEQEGRVDSHFSGDTVMVNLVGLLVHLWCIDLVKKVGNLCGDFVTVICTLHDMSRVRIMVKKGEGFLFHYWWMIVREIIEYGCPLSYARNNKEGCLTVGRAEATKEASHDPPQPVQASRCLLPRSPDLEDGWKSTASFSGTSKLHSQSSSSGTCFVHKELDGEN